MVAAAANFFSYSSSSAACQSSGSRRTSFLSSLPFWQSGVTAPTACCSIRSIRCFSSLSSNGGPRGRDTEDLAVKEVERILEEKRRSDLAARIASGEFTVQKPGLVSMLSTGLSKIGPAGKFLGELLVKLGGGGGGDDGECMAIPQAKGSFKAVGGQAFFIPLFELYLIYGGIFRLTFGPKSFLIVSEPELAKHILKDNCKAYSKGILAEILDFVMGKGLIPADFEIWRVRRRAIVPALHKKFVAAMINLFGRATYKLCGKLDRASSDGEDVEMESLFSRLTLDVIGKAVFNYDFDSLSLDNGIVEAVYTVLREAEQRSTSPIPTWEIPIWKDLSPRQQKVTKALKLINDTLDDLIAVCKRMVDEEKLQFHDEYMNEEDPSILHFLLASGDDVSSKQLRDDLMTLLIAGHETSAAVLTWTFYLLSKEPKVVAKLQEEVDSVLGDRFPTIEDMKKLKYTTRVISESMRLYPQPPVLIRRSIEADQLGKYPIKRGEDIFISVWNIHRSPLHWTDAESFNPERWPIDGPNPNEVNQNFSYLPFGGGPRKCVGDMFATFETVVATAMLVRRFNFEMALGAPSVEMTTGATIHTTEGLKMTVTHRFMPPVIPSLEKNVIKINGDSCLEANPGSFRWPRYQLTSPTKHLETRGHLGEVPLNTPLPSPKLLLVKRTLGSSHDRVGERGEVEDWRLHWRGGSPLGLCKLLNKGGICSPLSTFSQNPHPLSYPSPVGCHWR